MFEWSDEDLMVRDALRAFIEKEIRPHVDELETGQLPPFDITRKMLATFGIDAMNREQLEKDLAAEEAGEEKPKSGGGTLGSSMALILNMELAGVSLGLVGSMGVSMGLTVSTIRSRGTLAQKKRWLPELVTMEKVGAWAITEPASGSDALGGMTTTVKRDGDGGYLCDRRGRRRARRRCRGPRHHLCRARPQGGAREFRDDRAAPMRRQTLLQIHGLDQSDTEARQ